MLERPSLVGAELIRSFLFIEQQKLHSHRCVRDFCKRRAYDTLAPLFRWDGEEGLGMLDECTACN